MFRKKWLILLLGIMLLGALLRMDAFISMHYYLPSAYLPPLEGTAISLYKGHGFRIWPIPSYWAKKGRIVNPDEYLTWDDAPTVQDPSTLPYSCFNPGVSVTMMLLFKTFGLKYDYYQIYQLVLTWLLIPVIFYIGFHGFRSISVATCASLLYAISMPDIRFSLYLAREIYLSISIVAVLAFCVYLSTQKTRAIGRKDIFCAVLFGVLNALCVYYKNPAYIMFIAFPVILLFHVHWKKALVCGIVCWLSGLLVFSPWLIRNKIVFGKYEIGNEARYLVLWAGIGYRPNSIGINATDTVMFHRANLYFRLRDINPDNYFHTGARQYEEATKDMLLKYVSKQSHLFYSAFTRNLYRNYFMENTWPYYSGTINVPQLDYTNHLINELITVRDVQGKIIFLWGELLKIVTYLSFAGIIIAFLERPKLLPWSIPLLMTLVTISIVATDTLRYIFNTLPIHYLFASYMVTRAFRFAKTIPTSSWAWIKKK